MLGAVVAALAVLGSSHLAEARPRREAATAAPGTTVGPVSVAALPAEVGTTYRAILAGGPFAYPKDGIVFANRERLLPQHPRGFYREYTVTTPGSHDRGARRIVCGGSSAGDRPPIPPEACYYTADHYATFAQIAN